MKITVEEINEMLKASKEAGYDPRMADIFYVASLQMFSNKDVVYTMFFGKPQDDAKVKGYDSSRKVKFLKEYMKNKFFKNRTELLGTSANKGGKIYKDITFEENKEALIQLLSDIQVMADTGEIEKRDAVKLQTDIRVKLNDKFSVSEKWDEQRVIVESKYNDICPYCSHEIRRKTDEDMLREIEEKYILTPRNNKEDE